MSTLYDWHMTVLQAYFGSIARWIRRCQHCGARPIYSWSSRWLPVGPLCERCTDDPEAW